MAKPEAVAVRNVNSWLPKEVHHEGNGGGFGVNGTPDQYYEGDRDTLRVEYKYAVKLPKILDLADTTKKPHLSKLQNTWLSRAYDNNVRVAVILCTKDDGNYIFTNRSWESIWTKNRLVQQQYTRTEVAMWIASTVLKTCPKVLSKRSSTRTTNAT